MITFFGQAGGEHNGRVPTTRQLIDYTPAGYTARDDGAMQKGITPLFIVFDTGQYSGTTDITVNGKTDAHSNNCVYEKNSGLTFMRYASDSVGPLSNGKLYWDDQVNFENIYEYEKQANLAGFAGFSDWRIPNANELLILVEHTAPSAVPDTTIFPGFPNALVWTSTTKVNGIINAQGVNFTSGQLQASTKLTVTNYCILVRGGL